MYGTAKITRSVRRSMASWRSWGDGTQDQALVVPASVMVGGAMWQEPSRWWRLELSTAVEALSDSGSLQ